MPVARIIGDKRQARDVDGVDRGTGDVAEFSSELIERLPDWFELVKPKAKAEPKPKAGPTKAKPSLRKRAKK